MDAKATDSFRDRKLSANYFCGYVLNLIGRRTINIPEIILGVHGFMGFTVNTHHDCICLYFLLNTHARCMTWVPL